ncbi:MAG: hypothetical protein K2X39_03360 [Silvanigrellaceae bacterium]|nr:hypothetical protein [Silvanigrellaceae bacterium]
MNKLSTQELAFNQASPPLIWGSLVAIGSYFGYLLNPPEVDDPYVMVAENINFMPKHFAPNENIYKVNFHRFEEELDFSEKRKKNKNYKKPSKLFFSHSDHRANEMQSKRNPKPQHLKKDKSRMLKLG